MVSWPALNSVARWPNSSVHIRVRAGREVVPSGGVQRQHGRARPVRRVPRRCLRCDDRPELGFHALGQAQEAAERQPGLFTGQQVDPHGERRWVHAPAGYGWPPFYLGVEPEQAAHGQGRGSSRSSRPRGRAAAGPASAARCPQCTTTSCPTCRLPPCVEGGHQQPAMGAVQSPFMPDDAGQQAGRRRIGRHGDDRPAAVGVEAVEEAGVGQQQVVPGGGEGQDGGVGRRPSATISPYCACKPSIPRPGRAAGAGRCPTKSRPGRPRGPGGTARRSSELTHRDSFGFLPGNDKRSRNPCAIARAASFFPLVSHLFTVGATMEGRQRPPHYTR